MGKRLSQLEKGNKSAVLHSLLAIILKGLRVANQIISPYTNNNRCKQGETSVVEKSSKKADYLCHYET